MPNHTPVGRRRDQRLIHPARLAELERLAQEGRDMRAALGALEHERMEAMQIIRLAPNDPRSERARGFLQYESSLGDALLAILAKREGSAT